MILRSATIENYKCFPKLGPLEFSPGINVISGRNNAGKTALLRALTGRLAFNPHRSATVGAPRAGINEESSIVRCVFSLTGEEFRSDHPYAPAGFIYGGDHLNHAIERVRALRRKEDLALRADWKISRRHGLVATGHFDGELDINNRHQLVFDEKGDVTQLPGSGSSYLPDVFARNALARAYLFSAERPTVESSPIAGDSELQSDASNLPDVLLTLQANARANERFRALVRSVLPQIHHVSVFSAPNSAKIHVWKDGDSDRTELAFPLSESGTGIGQVLAILYVVATAKFPRIIAIDEPNSFLHPGAVRSLIEVFRDKEYNHHQYLLTTHSPDVLAAAAPEHFFMLQEGGGQVTAQRFEAAETKNITGFLREVGATLSGAFGADKILWLEGETEESCFPVIARELGGLSLHSTAMMAVVHTGDFDGRLRKTTVEIYERLSAGAGVLPPALGFVFDREKRPDSERKKLEAESKGRVAFLPRRTYENYLLDPDAIAAILNDEPPFKESATTCEAVLKWLDDRGNDKAFDARVSRATDLTKWVSDVNAPKLLDALFQELSGARLQYQKTKHSEALTRWLVRNQKEALSDIVEILRRFLAPA